MRRWLPRVGAACTAIVLAMTTPAFAQNALDSAAALQQQLDLSALAAHAAAQPVEVRLTTAQAAVLKNLGRSFGRTGDQAALMQGWQGYLAANRPPPGDIDALVAVVLRESYLQNSADLKAYAEKVKYANQQKARIRDQSKQAGTLRMAPGMLQLQMPGAGPQRSEIDKSISENDTKLNSAGEDGQLANVDLQNVLQQTQQSLQMMSNVSKMMHDTAMAVIRRMQ